MLLYIAPFPRYPNLNFFIFFKTFFPNISTIALSNPFPLVFILTFPSNISIIATSGLDNASCIMMSFILIYSVLGFLKNFNLAGVLKNNSFISMVVPLFLCTSFRLVTFPPKTVIWEPTSLSSTLEEILIFETALIDERASPLNP